MSETKWLVALIAINEDGLALDMPVGGALSTVPDILDAAIEGLSPSGSLSLERVYLHDDKEKDALITELEKRSLPYHVYATETRGEVCKEPFCADHRACVVIRANDYRH